ncbi:sugar transferase [Caloranaerobacter sp. TR13]|uniref:sugar transferase n=1 Tax=Caloranaerobacter sp. TR13 TaxID=1302151 RepID=UPI0006D3EC16|nr:sugar transferase [Caloranaerobacter sp. TR13]KPU27369.1 sugar transferase [Caloranaerobacter sp. TR13]
MSKICLNIQKSLKRLVDIILSILVLIVFIPFWLLIAILIKLDSPGPVLFIQRRPGLNTKPFSVYKFRTMRLGSEKMIKGKEVMLNDERITRIGKFLRRYKIDEIPQLLNVLKGEMSLVGPRPERMDYLPDYTEEELKRFQMRPGLTGLAQVSGNIYISLEDRHKYDVYYVENFSLWLDLKIIIRTIGVIVFGERKFVRNDLSNIKEEEIRSN